MSECPEPALLEAALAGDKEAFHALLAPTRRELLAYAYRMLGGYDDAECALEDARRIAWDGLAAYQPETSFRTWLYRIVSNTCIDTIRGEPRRVLPPGSPSEPPGDDEEWIEPFPDAMLPPAETPEAAVRLRQSIRLAFVAALQVLSARPRAALILHDVLDWSVAEIAAMLDTSVVAINSALQRSRAAVAKAAPPDDDHLAEHQAEALARYVHAWETGDLDGLVALLADGAILSERGPGRYRVVATAMNGEPAALAYQQVDGRYLATCLTVIRLDGDGRITALTMFALPALFAEWGFPAVLDAER